ncbi:hypothetical protein [Streptomyces sp. HUAS TT7]|uniref:hypothetical protein n=1 Tax=Streptomyces sp. HUAS TT7 TaxID=3447507 RepID=UPI003F65F7A5
MHLADESFLAATDWFDLVGRMLHPRRAAVSGMLPRVPRDLSGGTSASERRLVRQPVH